jgi:hypothetical protein
MRSVALVLGLLLASGCIQPPCVETYSPLVKLLVGVPFPMYFTMVFAAALMLGINDALHRGKRLSKGGLAAVAAACVALPIGMLSGSLVLAVVVWPMLVGLVVCLAFRNQGTDPEAQSWLLCLSGALEPSPADRFRAGGLACLLAFVTLVGSIFTSCSVSGAGQDCTWPDERPSPVGSADPKSN